MRKLLISFAAVLSLLALCACGGTAEITSEPVKPVISEVELSCGSFNADIEELSVMLEENDIEKLDEFTNLKTADFSGSTCEDAVYEWHIAHPSVDVTYSITLPDGEKLDNHTRSLDLSAMSRDDAISSIAVLPRFEGLETIILADESAENGIALDEAAEFAAVSPAALEYSFNLYGQSISAAGSEINLSHIAVNDNGEAVEKALAIMKNCTYLDMDQSGVGNERMAEIRDAHPDVKVVWRIWFGSSYSVRTDVDTILASSSMDSDQLTPENTQSLKYCTEVEYLDLGHNIGLTDISFVASMPKLKVLITSIDEIEDLTPLSCCPELEYAEMFALYGPLTDLSPLAGLTNLRHLNICGYEGITDISPLFGLTELERLWIGPYPKVPQEQIDEMQKAAPNCVIYTTAWYPLDEGWRFISHNPDVRDPRYELLRQQFHYDDGLAAYAYYFNDPLY